MTNGITKIVSSIYELKYVKERNSEVYKHIYLLTRTIKNIIYPDYKYVIYTDQNSYNKFNIGQMFNYPNVEIKFKELNSSNEIEIINNIRNFELSKGMNYDRIYCVDNYMEVILNKLKFLIDESNDCENVFWIDAGLIGTSCHDGWRDYMVNLVNSKNFLDKICEKINKFGFIHLKGNNIQMNYELKNRFFKTYGIDLKVVPGCLFGGKSELVKQVLNGYSETFLKHLKEHNELISEQEVLTVLTSINSSICHSFDFDDWLDLQKSFLKILDLYDEIKYSREKCYV